jgi:hypothetical protein
MPVEVDKPNTNNPAGRPKSLTEDIAIGMAVVVSQGNHLSIAARKFNVDPKLALRWMSLGKKFPDGIYNLFRALVLDAEVEGERRAVEAVLKAGYDGDVEQLKWFLERRFPERWGKNTGEIARIRKELRELIKEVARLEAIRDSERN